MRTARAERGSASGRRLASCSRFAKLWRSSCGSGCSGLNWQRIECLLQPTTPEGPLPAAAARGAASRHCRGHPRASGCHTAGPRSGRCDRRYSAVTVQRSLHHRHFRYGRDHARRLHQQRRLQGDLWPRPPGGP